MPTKGTTNAKTTVASPQQAKGRVTRTSRAKAAPAIQPGTQAVRRRRVATTSKKDQPVNDTVHARAARKPKAAAATPRTRTVKRPVLVVEPRGVNKDHYLKSSYLEPKTAHEPTIIEEAQAEADDQWSLTDKLEFSLFCGIFLLVGMAIGALL